MRHGWEGARRGAVSKSGARQEEKCSKREERGKAFENVAWFRRFDGHQISGAYNTRHGQESRNPDLFLGKGESLSRAYRNTRTKPAIPRAA